MTDPSQDRPGVIRRCVHWIRFELFEITGIHVWRWRFLWVWIIVFSALCFWLIGKNRESTNSIQDSREFAIRKQCEDTNVRHDNSIAALDKVIGDYKSDLEQQKISAATAKEKADLQKQIDDLVVARKQNVLLISALVPRQDCDAVVKTLTKPR